MPAAGEIDYLDDLLLEELRAGKPSKNQEYHAGGEKVNLHQRGRSGMSKARWRPATKEPGVMNKTEAAFEVLLRARLQAGEVVAYIFEPLRVRLGTDWKTTYAPDFLVCLSSGEIELIDVKGPGGWEQHTRIKIKTAARILPMFHWVGYQQKRAKGPFEREDF